MRAQDFSRIWLWLIAAVGLVCLTWASLGGYLDYVAWQRSPQDLEWRRWLAWSLFLRGMGLAAVLAALAGWFLLRRRIDRQIDTLVEACHAMALGEASPCPTLPNACKTWDAFPWPSR